ncbi:MAG: cell wall hydrolase [Ruminococcaceae bacterium]|nr:cell wall hydrolase [Oscillospiraceae bacterium]
MNPIFKKMCVILFALITLGRLPVSAAVVYDPSFIYSITEEEADFLIRSAAFAAGGSMRLEGRNNTNTAASYAARVGIIATVLNRLSDPRFPDSVTEIISSDNTFSKIAPAANIPSRDLEVTKSALDAALMGFDPTDGALYFSTPRVHCNRFAVTCEMGGYSFGVPEV